MVSVVIPTFEQTTLFEKAVNSVVNQSYDNIEIIIVDDNKTEDYSQYVVEFLRGLDGLPGRKIVYIKNEINSGSVFSRNAGIDIASGQFITFLDDDDVYKKDKIKKQLSSMLDSNAGYSVCNLALTNDHKNYRYRHRKFLNYDESLLTKHRKYHIGGTSTFMFSGEFLKKIDGFSHSDHGDEYYLMEKAIKNSPHFVHVNIVGVVALTDNTKGLSSWKNKIKTENILFAYKMNNIEGLSKKDIRYIKMRHHASKGLAYYNGKRYSLFIKEAVIAVFYDPIGLINLLNNKDF